MKFSTTSLFAVAALATAVFAGSSFADDDKKETKAKPVAKATATTKARPLTIAVDLHSSTELAGTLTDTSTLDLQSSFGVINVPLTEVAGIRFASADNASTTVVMLNGDSITGATDVKMITVETEWGTAEINGSMISSILFVPGLDWNSTEGLNGKRWKLVSTKAMAKAKAPVAAVKPVAPTATSRQPVRFQGSPQSVFRTR